MESAGDEKQAKGRKVWNRSGPYLGKHVFGSFFDKLTENNFTNAFKSVFRDESFKLCSKNAGFLGETRLGALGGRARARARAPTRRRS